MESFFQNTQWTVVFLWELMTHLFTDTTRNPRPGEENGKGTGDLARVACWGRNVSFRTLLAERLTPLVSVPHFPIIPPVRPATLLLPSELRVACVAALVYRDKSLLCLFCFLHRAEQAPHATGGYFTARSRRLFLGLRNLIFVSK